MGKRKHLSQQEISTVKAMIKSGINVGEIAEKFGVTTSAIYTYRRELEDENECKACGNKNRATSKFCDECGEPLLSESERVAEELRGCMAGIYSLLPETQRDKVHRAVKKATDVLERN